MSWPKLLEDGLEQPGGARFFRCALQVNPYDYLIRHSKKTAFSDEAGYNEALISALLEHRVEVIGITDHHQVKTAVGLWKAAEAAGIRVFPGFEAETKDGVHVLCLFDAGTDEGVMERILGDCGIHKGAADGQTCQYDLLEFLERSRVWGGVCIAAHVDGTKGLLKTLQQQARINAWTSPHLLAVSIHGSPSTADQALRTILENKNPEHARDRPIAVLNAKDVMSPEDVAEPEATSWIKMSEVTTEGLRQAFLDPESRIRLNTDPPPEDHAEFLCIGWEGGFLDGTAVRFNENLNVLVGGRGTGKSTIIESLRYALGLEPLGEEANQTHQGIVKDVLRSGTKVSLIVRSQRPSRRDYLIERTVPNPPVVRADSGEVLPVLPSDIVPESQVYGQHEISELTKSPEKQTRLLERFVDRDPSLDRRKSDLKRELERSRSRLIELRAEAEQIEERLASLPSLEETLKRFQEAGLEERLKEQSLLVREERLLSTADKRLDPFRRLLDELRQELPIDRAFLSGRAIDDLPGKSLLSDADKALKNLSDSLETLAENFDEVLNRARQDLTAVQERWLKRKSQVDASYEEILRDLQKSRVDGEEFISLRRQIEELRPLREAQKSVRRSLKELEENRRRLLTEWEDAKTEAYRELERASKSVNRQLAQRVRVKVTHAGNREPLITLLRSVPGRLAETVEILKTRDDISLPELAEAIRNDRPALQEVFGLPPSQADRLSRASPQLALEIEELDLPPTTEISLNVAAEGEVPVWKELRELSTGQKATALLLLLLLESEAPLVVDQPEDDLDNRFITEGIVPKMREEKRQRQFIFATHNANVPVLGDAELILGLVASGEAGQGHAEIPPENMGSIDSESVRRLVEEILEGGKEAFEMRRLKYGF